jgi:hypothetical protein
MATKIPMTSLEAQNQFFEIAQEHFNVGDLSQLKISQLGLNAAFFGFMAESLSYERDFLLDELPINTARLTRSLLNWAETLEFNVRKASPAAMRVLIRMKVADVIGFADSTLSTSNVSVLNLSKEDSFSANGIPFSLPTDLRIRVSQPGTSFQEVSSSFVGLPHSSLGVVTSNLSAETYTSNEEDKFGNQIQYLNIITRLFQVKHTVEEFTASSRSVEERTQFEVSFANQLAGLQVQYNPAPLGRDDLWREISVFQSKKSIDPEVISCYSGFPENGSTKIFFPLSSRYQKPADSSRLRISTIATYGSKGNLSYSGSLKLSSEDPRGFTIQVVPMENSSGGRDEPDKEQIRRALMEDLQVRDNITTESDLSLYLQKVLGFQTARFHSILVWKKRHDLERRLFSVFFVLKDQENGIIPTRTEDIYTDLAELKNRSYVISSGAAVFRDDEAGVHRLAKPADFPLASPQYNNLLRTPIMLALRTEPSPMVWGYSTHVQQSETLRSLAKLRTADFQAFITSMSVNRDPVSQNFYKVKITLASDIEVISSLRIENDLAVVGFIKKGKRTVGCFPMELDRRSGLNYVAKLYTSDDYDPSVGEFSLSKSLLDPTSGALIQNAWVPEDVSFEFVILARSTRAESERFPNPNSVVSRAKWETVLPALGLNAFSPMSSFDTPPVGNNPAKGRFSLWKRLSRVMNFQVKFLDGGGVILRSVPIVQSEYFASSQRSSWFRDSLDLAISRCEEVMGSLIENTDLGIQFVNTIGPSLNMTTPNCGIRVDVEVRASSGYSEGLETQIRTEVARVILEANNPLIPEELYISASLISRNVVNALPEVQELDITAIEGIRTSSVRWDGESIEDLEGEAVTAFVPEFLNVRRNWSGDSLPEVKVTFV